MQDDALWRVKRSGDAMRNRVSDRNEFDIEGTDHSTFTVDDRNEFGTVEQTSFFDAISRQAKREC